MKIGISLGLGVGFNPFNPVQIPNLAYSLQAGQSVTLSGSNVTSWGDTSGAGNPASVGVSGHYPTYTASDAQYNNQPTLTWTGGHGTQYLQSGTWTIPATATIFVVGHTVDNGVGSVFLNCGPSDNQIADISLFSGLYLYDGSVLQANVDSINTPRVIAGQFNGASSKIFVSAKTAAATGDAGSAGVGNALTVGNNTGLANGVNGKIAEMHIYGRILTTAEMNSMLVYLGNKFGITIGA